MTACDSPLNDNGFQSDPTWQKIDARGIFTFYIPSELEPQNVQGIDSYVGSFQSPTMRLSFDYGWYSGVPSDQGQKGYTKKETQIDEHRAIIISYQLDSYATEEGYEYFTAVHFPVTAEDQNGGINKLTMSAFCNTVIDISTAQTIFKTITFQ